jgi:hypothetical protein
MEVMVIDYQWILFIRIKIIHFLISVINYLEYLALLTILYDEKLLFFQNEVAENIKGG